MVAVQAPAFSVSRKTAHWSGVLPCCLVTRTAAVFSLRLARVDDTLILQWQEPENSEPYAWEESPSRRVIDRVEEFSVAYRRELDGDWITEWDKSFATPYQIRLRIKSSDRYWPDMIMGMGR